MPSSARPRGPEKPLTEEEKQERDQRRREYYERKLREVTKTGKPKDHKHADQIDFLDETSPLGRGEFL